MILQNVVFTLGKQNTMLRIEKTAIILLVRLTQNIIAIIFIVNIVLRPTRLPSGDRMNRARRRFARKTIFCFLRTFVHSIFRSAAFVKRTTTCRQRRRRVDWFFFFIFKFYHNVDFTSNTIPLTRRLRIPCFFDKTLSTYRLGFE